MVAGASDVVGAAAAAHQDVVGAFLISQPGDPAGAVGRDCEGGIIVGGRRLGELLFYGQSLYAGVGGHDGEWMCGRYS